MLDKDLQDHPEAEDNAAMLVDKDLPDHPEAEDHAAMLDDNLPDHPEAELEPPLSPKDFLRYAFIVKNNFEWKMTEQDALEAILHECGGRFTHTPSSESHTYSIPNM